MKVVRNKNNYFIKVKKNTLYGTPNGKDNKKLKFICIIEGY